MKFFFESIGFFILGIGEYDTGAKPDQNRSVFTLSAVPFAEPVIELGSGTAAFF